ARRGLAQVRLDGGVDRQDCVLVLDEIAKVGTLLVPNRSLHGERLPGQLESFPHWDRSDWGCCASSITPIATLINPNFPDAESQLRDVEAAARALGLQHIVLRVK